MGEVFVLLLSIDLTYTIYISYSDLKHTQICSHAQPGLNVETLSRQQWS